MKTMLQPGLDHLKDEARVWIFQSAIPISGELKERVEEQLAVFLATWAAHGAQLFSGFLIEKGRFIIIAVDEEYAAASGCSIDKLMRVIQDLDKRYELDLLNRMKVAYLSDHELQTCEVNAFSRLLETGQVDAQTMVYNNLIDNLGSLRRAWPCPVSQSWHANLVP